MDNIGILGFSDPLASWTHFAAAVAFLIASYPLIRKGRGSSTRTFALSIYCFSLIFLFSMSGTFHLLDRAGDARRILQRLDYAGIWVLIAGSFTPMHVILFRGLWRWLVLFVVWLIAVNGLVFEVIFFDSFPEWLALGFFLGLGWMGSITVYQFRKTYKGDSPTWLVAGGAFYSVGAIIDFARAPILVTGIFGPHEIFHIFVVLGALSHWIFIWQWADHPIHNKIFFEVSRFDDGHFRAEAKTDHLVAEAKDLDSLKSLLKDKVRAKYHPKIKPEIHLRFHNEEIIK